MATTSLPVLVAAIAASIALLQGCTVRPDYVPAPGSASATLRFETGTEQAIPVPVRFDHVPGEVICGEQIDARRLAMSGEGNLLIGDEGMDGVRIEANRRFKVMAMAVPGVLNPACGVISSFVPKSSHSYVGRFAYQGATCSLEFLEVDVADGVRRERPESSQRLETCQQ